MKKKIGRPKGAKGKSKGEKKKAKKADGFKRDDYDMTVKSEIEQLRTESSRVGPDIEKLRNGLSEVGRVIDLIHQNINTIGRTVRGQEEQIQILKRDGVSFHVAMSSKRDVITCPLCIKSFVVVEHGWINCPKCKGRLLVIKG